MATIQYECGCCNCKCGSVPVDHGAIAGAGYIPTTLYATLHSTACPCVDGLVVTLTWNTSAGEWIGSADACGTYISGASTFNMMVRVLFYCLKVSGTWLYLFQTQILQQDLQDFCETEDPAGETNSSIVCSPFSVTVGNDQITGWTTVPSPCASAGPCGTGAVSASISA